MHGGSPLEVRGGGDACRKVELKGTMIGKEHPSTLTTMNDLAFTILASKGSCSWSSECDTITGHRVHLVSALHRMQRYLAGCPKLQATKNLIWSQTSTARYVTGLRSTPQIYEFKYGDSGSSSLRCLEHGAVRRAEETEIMILPK